jgi:hypothetical protein
MVAENQRRIRPSILLPIQELFAHISRGLEGYMTQNFDKKASLQAGFLPRHWRPQRYCLMASKAMVMVTSSPT